MVSTVDSNLILVFVINCGGILVTIVSVFSVVANSAIDPSLRSILISFSIANVMGTTLSTYDTVVFVLYHHKRGEESFFMTITIMLSIVHITMLMLAEYVILTSCLRRRAGDFTGLIITSWIISITIGLATVVSRERSRTLFSIFFVVTIFLFTVTYFVLMRKHRRMQRLQMKYIKTFLQERPEAKMTKIVKRCWQLKFVGVVIFSYATCSLPWVINEIREVANQRNHDENVHFSSLIVYSLNFYFLSSVCIYLKYMHWLTRRKKNPAYRYIDQRVSYRYRDVHYFIDKCQPRVNPKQSRTNSTPW